MAKKSNIVPLPNQTKAVPTAVRHETAAGVVSLLETLISTKTAATFPEFQNAANAVATLRRYIAEREDAERPGVSVEASSTAPLADVPA